MPQFVPTNRPRMSYGDLMPRVEAMGLNVKGNPLVVIGVRGYYKSMGQLGANDSGIYDDAIFLVTPAHFSSYNANTDPSTRKPGYGYDEDTRGRARLQPGVWMAYRFDQHCSSSTPRHDAICQRAGPVNVMRDGTPDYPHTGEFGINIHKGKRNSTSSNGCQTIYPDQWDAFIRAAQDQARRCFGGQWKSQTIPYVLMLNSW